MNGQTIERQADLTQREREMGAIISAYNEVTEGLKTAHDRLRLEVNRLREELQEKNAELRRSERLAALGEMAAGLAHEVRNPLGGIALYSSLLEKELASHPKARDAAKKITQGVRSLEQLISQILDFAQEDRLEKRLCPMGTILCEAEDGLHAWAEEYGAAMVIEPSALEARVDCDPLRLRQVLTNLMQNGLQAAGKGGNVWVSGEVIRSPGDEAVIEIEICDDGPGIPADQLEWIFNPFHTTRATGTGLGLAIVHRIVEAHGGTIRASNRSEGGARFVLRLPLAEVEVAVTQSA